MSKPQLQTAAGFTLLELLLVVALLGLLAAMVWPQAGALNDSRREQITRQRLAEIRQALLGHEQLVDGLNRERIIGGYVNDFGAWPKLYEPGAAIPGATAVGDQRGSFNGRRFSWHPWTKVNDGQKESLAQPLGLWTRHLDDYTEIEDHQLDRERWQGPYLVPPTAARPDAGSHYAARQLEYEGLDPVDRYQFHLLQGEHQLLDGWGRAFRFFIYDDDDPDGVGDIFKVISLGADGNAEWPDPDDIANYDPDAPANRDNLVLKLRESDWRVVYEQQRLRSRSRQQLLIITEDLLERLARSIIGTAPAGANTGYTGDLLGWPWLYNWVCRDDADKTVACDDITAVTAGAWEHSWCTGVDGTDCTPFAYGQPRDLWFQGKQEDNHFGVGWRHAYHPPPPAAGEAELLRDAWDRPFHLFLVKEKLDGACSGKEQLLLLSGGPDGRFCFPPQAASSCPTEGGAAALADRTAFCWDDYKPAHEDNKDNLLRLIGRGEWRPGYFTLVTLEVVNVPADPPHDQLKCRLFGVLDHDDQLQNPLLVADQDGIVTIVTDEDGTWTVGNATTPALQFAADTYHLISGGRHLVCWADTNNNNNDDLPDSDESGWSKIFPITAHPGKLTLVEQLTLDFNEFKPLP